MNNGKQSEQLLKVLGGHSASLDRTSKCRGLSEQPLYSGGHKAMQHETRNWNNFDKCEPEQQYRLGTVSYKITGGLKPVLQVPNLTLSFCSGSQHLVSSSVLVMLFRTVTLVFQSGTVLMATYSTSEGCKPKLRSRLMC